MSNRPLTVAWFSFFPVEWLDDVPLEVSGLPRGHPATWQQALLPELEKNPNIKLHILVLRKQFRCDSSFDRHGVHFHLLKTTGRLRATSLFWYDTLLIRRALRRIHPDLVHAWGTEQGAGLVATRLPYPSLISIQGLFTYFRQQVELGPYERLIQLLEIRTLRRARAVSAESATTVEQVRCLNPKLHLFHIEHPPLAEYTQVIRQPETTPPILLVVGTWDFRKGSDVLLRALDGLRNQVRFRLICITRSQALERKDITQSVSAEFLRQIEFKSKLSTEQMMAEFGRATMLLMPSRADTGPVAVKEAVTAGLPVVASNVGGVPEYVVPGKNGLICTPGSVESFQRQVLGALRHPLLGRGQVDSIVLQEKRTYLAGKRAADQFMAAYQTILANHS